MALDIWGDKPKSQIDAITIDEEIAALIQAHEDDEDAHLEMGESLQSHKASEIIDHLAYSVLRDKLAFDRFTIDTVFESIDAWSTSGNVYIAGINALAVATAASLNAEAYAYIGVTDITDTQSYYSQSPEMQVRVRFGSVSNITAYIGILDESVPAGFGFKLVNNTLYAIYTDDDDAEVTESLATVSAYTVYTLWCRYDYATKTHYWYINDVEVHSAVYDHNLNMDVIVKFYVKTTNTSAKEIQFSNLHFDADYI